MILTQTLALLSEAPHLPGRKTSKYEVRFLNSEKNLLDNQNEPLKVRLKKEPSDWPKDF